MGQPFREERFPQGALLAAGGLVALALLAAAAGRWLGAGMVETPSAPPAVSRELRFEDRDDGGVLVLDAADGRVVAAIESGEGGFIRGVLRGLARERRSQGIGPEPPFSLQLTAGGELFLADPATSQLVNLNAFGPTNAGAFLRLLDGASGSLTSAGRPDEDDKGG